jgi:hypothetical protein
MYTIRAYDRNHNQLWIGSRAVVNANDVAHVETRTAKGIINTYELKRGLIIDPETGKPLRIGTLRTGNSAIGKTHSRSIAYFRTCENGRVFEIYITKSGRNFGIRNYQTRSAADGKCHIVGAAPVPGPYILKVNVEKYCVVIGEGDPNGLRGSDWMHDKHEDTAITVAECYKVFKGYDGWSGWMLSKYVPKDDYCEIIDGRLIDFTKDQMIAALKQLGEEFTL